MNKLFFFLLAVLITQCVSADYITHNINNGCNDNVLDVFDDMAVLLPVFNINTYNCNNGYYLPKDALGCVPCPSGYDCPGGTYAYNHDKNQGISYKKPVSENVYKGCNIGLLFPDESENTKLLPVFTPAIYTCTSGYYLPANIDECRKCLNDHYCPGGQLTFNETTPQGLIECPSNHPFAPAGMWLESQCGRKLHVGDDILYMHQQPAHPTIHRLYIGHPNGIYSANAVARDMNSNTFPKMSEGMSKGFHVTIDNVEYLICNDSVPECLND